MKTLRCLLLAALCGTPLWGQGSQQDYERAANLPQRTRGKVFRHQVRPHWFEADRLWYHVRTGPNSAEFVEASASQRRRQPAFDHARLASSLSSVLGREVNADNLPFSSIDLRSDGVAFSVKGTRYQCTFRDYTVAPISGEQNREEHLPNLARMRNSGDSHEETFLRLRNASKETLRLFWIDSGGRRRAYGTVAPGELREQHTFVEHIWLVTTDAGRELAVFAAEASDREAVVDGSEKLEKRRGRRSPSSERSYASPDGSWEALIQDHNVHVRDAAGKLVQLSRSGDAEHPFQTNFHWSPDGRYLVAIQRTLGEAREVHLIESSPGDQLQPKLHSMRYAKPGDKLNVDRPCLFDVREGREIKLEDALFKNAWRISDIRWQPDSQRFTFLYNQRGHQVLRVIVVDASTGETAALVNEQSETFIDYAYKRYLHHEPDTDELIWMSERSGWNHLYLYDTNTGQVKHAITQGPWVVRGVDRVDAQRRQVWFRASGVYPEQDPYFIHYGRINFDGSELTWLTSGNGTHTIEYSPNGEYFIDTYSRVDLPPVTELRRSADGEHLVTLERGDWSALQRAGWQPPKRFRAKARDDETDIFGVIYFPTNFDENKQYPVIEKIYAGPHGSFVPKSFSAFRRVQSYAELGFIMVQIDGMGTSNRSKAFHDICWKNLGDSGFPDRRLWLQAAAKKFPQMDLSRVGIYGGSAGGQSALRALLAHGDFYHVAVADCGCHDNRMDKVWWNELWMGWPVGPHYEEQSNVTQAHRLQGKLLLTVGELDRNVDPASTLQVVNALIKADKDFDFLLVPGAGHGVGETPYANRRRQDFFVRHLWGTEPRHRAP